MQDLLYIKTEELFYIVQDVPSSVSSSTVTIVITRLSDNYTWDFTNEEFTSSSTSGTMTYVSGILWKASFTPDQEDTYIVKITFSTTDYYQTLIAKGGSEVLPFATQSDVAICNIALTMLGADTITSLDENTENARKLNAVYPYIRNEVLRAYPWNFAIRWASLAQLSETITNDYSYVYQLPTDPKCLRVIGLDEDNEDEDFRVENGKLYCDVSSVSIQYIAEITDATKFDSQFVTALAARLSAELAYAITGSLDVKKERWEDYYLKLREARSADSQEGTVDKKNTSNWVDSRAESDWS